MTPEAFCYWLQGALELADMKEMSPEDVQKIKDHLKLVFDKLTPVYPAGIQLTPAVQPFYDGVGQQLVQRTVSNGTGYLPPAESITISC